MGGLQQGLEASIVTAHQQDAGERYARWHPRGRGPLFGRGAAAALVLALAGTGLAVGAPAEGSGADTAGAGTAQRAGAAHTIDWRPCDGDGKSKGGASKTGRGDGDPGQDGSEDRSGAGSEPGAECGTLRVPVDWAEPGGASFDLHLARRTAGSPGKRAGSLVFGPGGPGDSGVERIRTGMSRFSETLRDRFDVVSFDPRGVGRSNPVVCSAELLARQPSPLIGSEAAFAETVRYNRVLREDCRRRTGPLFDHVDTLSMVKDLDAVRAALGERALTFHGSSYGTLLGEQYAERYPGRVRAMVLESVVDHSAGTGDFLRSQAATVQDSFEEFAAWCDRTESCALHGRDVPEVWGRLLARAEAGKLPDPEDPARALSAFEVSVLAMKRFYDPQWAELAQTLAALDGTGDVRRQADGPPRAQTGEAPRARADERQEKRKGKSKSKGKGAAGAGVAPNPFEVFCQDWDLPAADYPAYAAQLRRVAEVAPDMRYPRALMSVSACLGGPSPVANPQHRLRVPPGAPILLTNSRHDPATGYDWAASVTRQLGGRGVLLGYEGWGHGTYTSSPCARRAVDRYLLTRETPAPGTRCPAVEPAG
ncbi:alpha/beta hydrolase [Streptomyces sp. LD120]|uniref:Alpha/beta hydrolase n=1 Tax=Streptomyces physcomitrii TaxID=2724184 RepID=A0ABX1H3T3_9ACTN|nr:alpha/beta hydrolase [Streptomyces physcomitrii]